MEKLKKEWLSSLKIVEESNVVKEVKC